MNRMTPSELAALATLLKRKLTRALIRLWDGHPTRRVAAWSQALEPFGPAYVHWREDLLQAKDNPGQLAHVVVDLIARLDRDFPG